MPHDSLVHGPDMVSLIRGYFLNGIKASEVTAALPEPIDVRYQGVDVNDGSPVVAHPDDNDLFPQRR